MNCSTPGLPVHNQLPEFTQTHVHRVSDAIQLSHPNANENYSEVSPHTYHNEPHQKKLQAINAGEDVEKREPSYNLGGNAN